MDCPKSVVPSHLLQERGPRLVVINPGSANVRIGLAHQDTPFYIPNWVARYTPNQVPKRSVQDQMSRVDGCNTHNGKESRYTWTTVTESECVSHISDACHFNSGRYAPLQFWPCLPAVGLPADNCSLAEGIPTILPDAGSPYL